MRGRRIRMAKFVVVITVLGAIAHFALSNQSQLAKAAAAMQTGNPVPSTVENLSLGLNHFEAHCATCHGLNGKADTDKGKSVGAADLTADEVQSQPDADLFRAISTGVAGTVMPAFSKTHSATEIWQIVAFLRELPTLTNEERSKLEAAMPANSGHNHDVTHQHLDSHEQPQAEAGTHHEHPAPSAQADQHHEAAPAAQPEHGHEHGNTDEMNHQMPGHDMNAMMSTITGGPFKSMSAIGSGTSLIPSSAPGYMWHWMKDGWMIMAHGNLIAGFNHEGGPRGVNKAESENWVMLMAERDAGPGRLMFRGMFSAEPWTAPRRGFPELFQTGETFEGRPIIDAQHPHDLFMELAAAYNIKLSENVALNFYGGPVGEPALGPTAFMHRMSASENPAAPLGHHWQDSTHITHGVITAGVTAWRFRFESSLFHGAEPDENRKDIELGKLDSWSGRVWFTPTPNWSMQFSYGHLVHPEILEPGNLKRLTASVSYNRNWSDGNWATTLIWGRNHELHGNSNSYLLESTANFIDKNYLYTRLELVDKQGLLEENIFGRAGLDVFHPIGNGFELGDRFDQFFRVGGFTLGGVRDIIADPKLRVGIGADVTFYHVPGGLKSIYGSNPTSLHVFLRIRPGKMH